MSTPRLFVAGATGYTGSALVEVAREQGLDVVAHVRPGSSRVDAARRRFEDLGATVDLTPWEAEAMARTLTERAPTHAFALLGTTKRRGREAAKHGSEETYETVDRDLTLMLLGACAGVEPRPRFVYLSSLGADRPGRNAYLRARFEVEEALRASTVPWTVARPSFISGPDRQESRPAERAASVASDAVLGALAAVGVRGPRDRYGTLSSHELARALLSAALDPACAGQVLDAAALRRRSGGPAPS